jgi:hypothetical protein
MITLYNIGDVAGKYIGALTIFKMLSFYAAVIFRFVFYATFLLTAH